MAETKGHCKKHGIEFDLREGCPQCLTEKQIGIENIDEGIKRIKEAGDDPNYYPDGKDLEVKNYYDQALKLQEYAEARVIATVEDIKLATNDLSIIAKLRKAMEEKKREYLDPLKAQAEAIRETYSILMDPIFRADKLTRDKILAYQKEQERKRQEQEEINQMRMEAAQKEKALKGEITEPVELVEVAPEAPKRVSTDMGMVGQRMIRKWELVDMALVPEEYKILDGTKITKVVKAGIPSIPGIRIYEEPILTVSAR